MDSTAKQPDGVDEEEKEEDEEDAGFRNFIMPDDIIAMPSTTVRYLEWLENCERKYMCRESEMLTFKTRCCSMQRK